VEDWIAEHPHSVWRAHSDEVNATLVRRWLPERSDGRLLKTDLFDEIASDGLHSVLASRAGTVFGLDVSAYTAHAVSRKYPDIAASAADIRRLTPTFAFLCRRILGQAMEKDSLRSSSSPQRTIRLLVSGWSSGKATLLCSGHGLEDQQDQQELFC
jgi:hypothetical protein